jgi:peptidyl-prolyl cis-trans isomerase-like protein 2
MEERRRQEEMQERFKVAGNHVSVKTKVNNMRTTGAGSTSFTSTVMPQLGNNGMQQVNARVEEIIYRNPTKKGYVRLHTSLGDLNVELHCDVAPRTCENFLTLCAAGYYDGVAFHRSIKNFMIQGGDPSGTGSGGQCIWGQKFKDEITHLQHTGRGVLSMANSGPNTNGSQFFMMYKSAAHLDGKHSVFGSIVGGMETLGKMERVPTDAKDKPREPITITGATVFTNPYREMAEEEDRLEEEELQKEEKEALARWGCTSPIQLPRSSKSSLKAPGFNHGTRHVRNWFHSLLFRIQLVPLQPGRRR